MQDDMSEFVGSGGLDTVLLTTKDETSASRPEGSLPVRFAGRGSLSVELYQTDSNPQISPSGRLAQMNLSDGGAVSPMIPELRPLEEEHGSYRYDEMMFPPVRGKRYVTFPSPMIDRLIARLADISKRVCRQYIWRHGNAFSWAKR